MSETAVPVHGTAVTRARFHAARGAALARAVGASRPVTNSTWSTRYSYYSSDHRLVVVASDVGHGDADLALAHALMAQRSDPQWAELAIVLPNGHDRSTLQRSAWLLADRQPSVYTYEAGDAVTKRPVPSRDETVRRVGAGPAGSDPVAEFRRAATPMSLPDHDGFGGAIEAFATARSLDPAHRQRELAWHHFGLRMLSVRRGKGCLRIRAGIHGADAITPKTGGSITIELPHGDALASAQLAEIERFIDLGIDAHSAHGGFHRPDEHWLQSVLAAAPGTIGLMHTHREVPAWRPAAPKDPAKSKKWARGFIDLAGYSSETERNTLVETKLSSNDDPLLLFQGLDYYIWSLAYEDALHEMGVWTNPAPVEVLYVVASDPSDESIHVSHALGAQVDAFVPEFPWRMASVTSWFGDGPMQAVPMTVPAV